MTHDPNPTHHRNHGFHCLQRVEIDFHAAGRVRGWTCEEVPRLIVELDNGTFAEFPAEYVSPEPTEADNVVPLPLRGYGPSPCDVEPGGGAA